MIIVLTMQVRSHVVMTRFCNERFDENSGKLYSNCMLLVCVQFCLQGRALVLVFVILCVCYIVVVGFFFFFFSLLFLDWFGLEGGGGGGGGSVLTLTHGRHQSMSYILV